MERRLTRKIAFFLYFEGKEAPNITYDKNLRGRVSLKGAGCTRVKGVPLVHLAFFSLSYSTFRFKIGISPLKSTW